MSVAIICNRYASMISSMQFLWPKCIHEHIRDANVNGCYRKKSKKGLTIDTKRGEGGGGTRLECECVRDDVVDISFIQFNVISGFAFRTRHLISLIVADAEPDQRCALWLFFCWCRIKLIEVTMDRLSATAFMIAHKVATEWDKGGGDYMNAFGQILGIRFL